MSEESKKKQRTVRLAKDPNGFVRNVERSQWSEPLVVRLAEEIWRLEKRIERAEAIGRADKGELRSLRDSANRMRDALIEREVETIDHTGQAYDSGLQLEVLDARGDGPDLVIIETIRPTILHQRRVLRQGQVVIGHASDLEGD